MLRPFVANGEAHASDFSKSSQLRRFDETEVEAQQEEDEVGNGAQAADLRRKDKACAKERD